MTRERERKSENRRNGSTTGRDHALVKRSRKGEFHGIAEGGGREYKGSSARVGGWRRKAKRTIWPSASERGAAWKHFSVPAAKQFSDRRFVADFRSA